MEKSIGIFRPKISHLEKGLGQDISEKFMKVIYNL